MSSSSTENNTFFGYLGKTIFPSSTPAQSNGSSTGTTPFNESTRVANELSALFPNHESLKPPRLVVVGSQSSGKSTLCEAILGLPILLKGSSITTRTPIQINIVHSPRLSATLVEVGDYEQETWKPSLKVETTNGAMSADNIQRINAELERLTSEKAGKAKNVSAHPIHIRVYSPHMSNFSLIDLPGLTAVATTDKGQPKDIKAKIQSLVASYISNKNTVILAVIPARTDIEADMALEVVKLHDPTGSRSIGVLTKVDTMISQGADITQYICDDGSVSKDLRMRHGYFGVSCNQSTEQEDKFFRTHRVYGPLLESTQRLGVEALRNALLRVLSDHFRESLPGFVKQLRELEVSTRHELSEMGPCIPTDPSHRSVISTQYISQFYKCFVHELNMRYAQTSAGRDLKEVFERYRQRVSSFDPFTVEAFPDDYIRNIAKNNSGNHMCFVIPPEHVIEWCLQDPEKRPIYTMTQDAVQCLEEVIGVMHCLLTTILSKPPLCNFPAMIQFIQESVTTDIIVQFKTLTTQKLEELFLMEETYVFTDDREFIEALMNYLKSIQSIQKVDATLLRGLLKTYFRTTVQRHIQNNVPKCIMLQLTRIVHETLHKTLLERASKCKRDLLETDNTSQQQRRKSLMEQKKKLDASIALVEGFTSTM